MTTSRVRTSIVLVHNDRLLTFKAVDPHSQKEYYFLPGGRIEKGESAVEAAVRETLEETGFDIEVEGSSAVDKEYAFHWNDENYDCLTIFYRARLLQPFQQPKKVTDADYHRGVHWLPVAEIPTAFAYTKEILQAVQELISSAF